MSIIEFGALGDLVASFGVIVTLIYLALEMRRNTRVLRLNSAQDLSKELQGMFSLLASNEGLSAVFLKAATQPELEGLTRLRYYTFCGNVMRIFDNAYLQYREKNLPQAEWSSLRQMLVDYKQMPAFSSYWKDRKHWSSDDFRRYMDEQILPAAGTVVPGQYAAPVDMQQ